MTRKTATRDETTNSVPFVVFAIDFQLKMIRDCIEETVAANDDRATADLRRCWARAQGFVSAARTALRFLEFFERVLREERGSRFLEISR